ncbi:hypothetical protein MTBBW1_240007 [Desulfamplus magnetovallimortis]|uniref:Uncharacterized protein n=1 Tax=Desulfamplus magnetovallimortis TaxID=1246637 RepID=A0A1W1HEE4_9BACT|nr:hypothetical protein MTBBW1_240007 [Desulfamplus magnetovallimortis]
MPIHLTLKKYPLPGSEIFSLNVLGERLGRLFYPESFNMTE